MIAVKVQKDEDGNAARVRVEGHAFFARYGQDIVCAAASALTQTTIMAMQKFLSVDPLVEKKEGCLALVVPEHLRQDKKQKAQLLLETMVLGLKEIAASYPGYIEVQEEYMP
ncbi:MAG: ribosomal-processing cysteine protease Prp [Firmicutes bacterium]|nr:ribosomal-processing cysteine protease Prp [Bacillota bacterium]